MYWMLAEISREFLKHISVAGVFLVIILFIFRDEFRCYDIDIDRYRDNDIDTDLDDYDLLNKQGSTSSNQGKNSKMKRFAVKKNGQYKYYRMNQYGELFEEDNTEMKNE